MPYGELPPLTDKEFQQAHQAADLPEAWPREKIHAFFERLLQEYPQEWQQAFDWNADAWLAQMRTENGRVTPYNPTGRRYKRKQLKVMAQQYAFDAMGVNYAEQAKTSDELLSRAESMAFIGSLARKSLS